MISIERSETAQKVHWKSETNSVQGKMQSENFFCDGWKRKKIWTEFCLGLNLSQTEFCLKLNLSRISYLSCISYAIF